MRIYKKKSFLNKVIHKFRNGIFSPFFTSEIFFCVCRPEILIKTHKLDLLLKDYSSLVFSEYFPSEAIKFRCSIRKWQPLKKLLVGTKKKKQKRRRRGSL